MRMDGWMGLIWPGIGAGAGRVVNVVAIYALYKMQGFFD